MVSAIWVPPVMLLGQGGGCDAPPHTELSALQVPTGGVQTGGSVCPLPPPSPAHLTSNIFSMSLYLPFSSSPHEVRLQ